MLTPTSSSTPSQRYGEVPYWDVRGLARHGKAWQGMARHLLRSPLEVTKHHARKNNDEEKVEMIEEKQRRLRANFALLSSLALKGKAGM